MRMPFLTVSITLQSDIRNCVLNSTVHLPFEDKEKNDGHNAFKKRAPAAKRGFHITPSLKLTGCQHIEERIAILILLRSLWARAFKAYDVSRMQLKRMLSPSVSIVIIGFMWSAQCS